MDNGKRFAVPEGASKDQQKQTQIQTQTKTQVPEQTQAQQQGDGIADASSNPGSTALGTEGTGGVNTEQGEGRRFWSEMKMTKWTANQ